QLIPEGFPQKVYITFDVDGLDPSIMPATGTPEPGGLGWWQAMDCLETITTSRTVIGFDVVELAPIPNLHAADFTAARLVYNLMGMVTRKDQAERP
ncbi:MAG: arginase family protein, partial [Desulfobulbaceae bacterium]|nr:arginase family protein [Desulfobulbaceae bacterium]